MEEDLNKTFGNIHAARIAAGVVPDLHISAARAARYLGTSRQWVGDLARQGKLGWFRLAPTGKLYGSTVDVENEKLQMEAGQLYSAKSL